jgi:N-acetylglutamate synthase/N-acetylornithine aminotransferase
LQSIKCALGLCCVAAGVEFDQNNLAVRLGSMQLMEAGQPLTTAAAAAALAGVEFDQNNLSVRLGTMQLMEAGQPLTAAAAADCCCCCCTCRC